MELRGAHVVVTGGSRGIGAAIAGRFAGEGARVTVVARQAEPLARAAAAIGAGALATDLTDPGTIGDVIGSIESRFGPVDILVNNAGTPGGGAHFDLAGDDLRHLLTLNLLAPAELSRQILPGMIARGRGHIVNMSSLAGVAALPGMAGYAASKAGLSHLTAGLRADLRGLPIGTTLVELGFVATDLRERLLAYGPTAAAHRRLCDLRVLTDVDVDRVARETVRAVAGGRRHLRLPRRSRPLAALPELPRRAVELALAGVAPRVSARRG